MRRKRAIVCVILVVCLALCGVLYATRPQIPTGGAGENMIYSVVTEPTEAPPALSESQKVSYERMVRQSVMELISTGAAQNAVDAARETAAFAARYPGETSAKGRMMYHSAAALEEILETLERREDTAVLRQHIAEYQKAYGELTAQEQAGLPPITESDYHLAQLAAHEKGYRAYDEMVLTFGGDNSFTTNTIADYSTSFGKLYTRREIGPDTVLHHLLPLTAGDSKTFFCNSQIFSDTIKGTGVYASLNERAEVYLGGGVDAVSAANKYSAARGEEGLNSTKAALDALQIEMLGNGSASLVQDRGASATVLTLNCGSDMPNDESRLASYTGQVKAAKEAGAVIAYVFWDSGVETTASQKETARALVDAGADVVIGCGTERVQGAELYNGAYIFYGVGRLVWGDNPYLKEGDYSLIVRVKVAPIKGESRVREVSVVPCNLSTSWEAGKNNYQPTPQFGERAKAILGEVVQKSAALEHGVKELPHYDIP